MCLTPSSKIFRKETKKKTTTTVVTITKRKRPSDGDTTTKFKLIKQEIHIAYISVNEGRKHRKMERSRTFECNLGRQDNIP